MKDRKQKWTYDKTLQYVKNQILCPPLPRKVFIIQVTETLTVYLNKIINMKVSRNYRSYEDLDMI